MTPAGQEQRIRAAVDRLLAVADAAGGYGFDTYDTRIGPFYAWLYARRERSRLANLAVSALYATDLAAPILYRRLRGIPKTWDPMGNSYRAGAHLALALLGDREAHCAAARCILDQVVAKAVGTAGMRGFALGFPCITGSYKNWPTDVPVSHYTLRVLRVLLRYTRTTGDRRYAATIEEGVRFLTEGLPWVERDGTLGVGYTPADPLQVLNIWADIASVLATHGRLSGNSAHQERAIRLIRGVIGHQLADGTWPYFARWERPPGQVDNSHTAMVLGAIADVALCHPEALLPEAQAALERGIPPWIDLFFDESTGRHWNDSAKPGHACTVSLGDALYAIARLRRRELGLSAGLRQRLDTLADRIVAWSLDHLRLRNGRFCERRIGWWTYAVQSIRSFDGLTADALALHLAKTQADASWAI